MLDYTGKPIGKNTGATTANEAIVDAYDQNNQAIKTVAAGAGALGAFIVNVTTAGTAVPLHANYPCRKVIIQARKDNTGSIYVGGSDARSSEYGAELFHHDLLPAIEVSNLNLIYINAAVSGEGVSVIVI